MTPCHQFPSGVILPLERRLALLDWAARTDAWVVEDDYVSEFRYEGRPLEALQSLDRNGRVIYIGTFAKTLIPALRLGYLVLPRALVRPFVAAKWVSDRFTTPLPQAALAEVGDYPCRINSQTYLADMYATHGFVADGEEFLEDGIPHVPMIKAGSHTEARQS